MTTIHQFAPVISAGDGVSGSVFFTRMLLRSLGYRSEIYAWKTADELAVEVNPLQQFDSDSCDLLLVHHSMGHDLEAWLTSTTCSRVLVYHNITPAKYFQALSSEHQYSIKGRQQLRQWRVLFAGAIGVSPYNCAELEELGYDKPAVIPLLVDTNRFAGTTEAPNSAWRLQENETLILSVGRLVENKRQHLLLEALWHFNNMSPGQRARLVLVGSTTTAGYQHQLLARACELGLEGSVTITGKCSDGQLRWLYNNAQLMWCASEHEGFCIPLVEANFFGLPAVAFASSNIPDTLGASGILIKQPNPVTMAAATASLLEDPRLSDALEKAGNDNLQRYSADTLLPLLHNFLEKQGFTP